MKFCCQEEFLYISKKLPPNVGFIRKSYFGPPWSVQLISADYGQSAWSRSWTWDKVFLLLLSSSVRILTVNLCLQPPRMDGRRRIEPRGAPIQFPLPTYPDSHDGSVQIVQVQIWIILIKNILWEIENNMKKYWIFWREFWWRSHHEDEKSARS